jgi:tRNA1(Val) A37 N6-methylase TrmN6
VDVTRDSLLGGRVYYAQPARGFRSGIEPVLLAASVPAKSGQRVLEAGSGAGAALLCLAARVPGIWGVGVERSPELVELARHNASANQQARLSFIVADIGCAGDLGSFDHACANPPYHSAEGTPSPLPGRESAKRAHPALLAEWARQLGARLVHRGTLTLVLPVALMQAAFAALTGAHCQPTAVLPLWPSVGLGAKLMLARGVKGGRGPLRLLPGLALHAAQGAFTPEAEAVLRTGAALEL